MKTIICDIDGTLTSMWPIERAVLLQLLGEQNTEELDHLKSLGVSETYRLYCKLSRQKISKPQYQELYHQTFQNCTAERVFPTLVEYPAVNWICQNSTKFRFVYATGGQRAETLYVLDQLGILQYFDVEHSVDKTSCRFSKRTGIPFRKILKYYPDSLLLTDSQTDCLGARKVGLPYIYLPDPTQQLLKLK